MLKWAQTNSDYALPIVEKIDHLLIVQKSCPEIEKVVPLYQFILKQFTTAANYYYRADLDNSDTPPVTIPKLLSGAESLINITLKLQDMVKYIENALTDNDTETAPLLSRAIAEYNFISKNFMVYMEAIFCDNPIERSRIETGFQFVTKAGMYYSQAAIFRKEANIKKKIEKIHPQSNLQIWSLFFLNRANVLRSSRPLFGFEITRPIRNQPE